MSMHLMAGNYNLLNSVNKLYSPYNKSSSLLCQMTMKLLKQDPGLADTVSEFQAGGCGSRKEKDYYLKIIQKAD